MLAEQPASVEAKAPPKAVHLTASEREARGKAARAEIPRAAHADFDAPANRDPIAVLEQQATTRVPELVPIRYGRMLVSPFAFYRGGAAIMAQDLAATPRSGLSAQLCGDAHLSNFGGFASPSRRLVFDLNDFDETLRGPFEWDMKRLAASFEIAGRDRGFKSEERRAAVRAAVRSYRESIRAFAQMTNLAVWYSQLDVEGVMARLQAGGDDKKTEKDGRASRSRRRIRRTA